MNVRTIYDRDLDDEVNIDEQFKDVGDDLVADAEEIEDDVGDLDDVAVAGECDELGVISAIASAVEAIDVAGPARDYRVIERPTLGELEGADDDDPYWAD